MTTAAETIDTAIARSIEHDEIVQLEWTAELEEELLGRGPEDYTDEAERVDAWGEDDDGNDWRLHLVRPEVRS